MPHVASSYHPTGIHSHSHHETMAIFSQHLSYPWRLGSSIITKSPHNKLPRIKSKTNGYGQMDMFFENSHETHHETHHETSWNIMKPIMKHHETSWNPSWNIMKHHETHHETSWNIMKHHETHHETSNNTMPFILKTVILAVLRCLLPPQRGRFEAPTSWPRRRATEKQRLEAGDLWGKWKI